MKTRNDILAEYVRSRYPEIEKTFDFAAYSAGVALKELGRCIKEAFGGTDKEVDDVCDSEHKDREVFVWHRLPIPPSSPAYQQHENAHLQLYRRSRTRLLG